MHEHEKQHECILHDKQGEELVRVSSTGCHDTPVEIEGTSGACLFVKHHVGTRTNQWRHIASIGLDVKGNLIIGLTNPDTKEHIVVTFDKLKTLLGT